MISHIQSMFYSLRWTAEFLPRLCVPCHGLMIIYTTPRKWQDTAHYKKCMHMKMSKPRRKKQTLFIARNKISLLFCINREDNFQIVVLSWNSFQELVGTIYFLGFKLTFFPSWSNWDRSLHKFPSNFKTKISATQQTEL